MCVFNNILVPKAQRDLMVAAAYLTVSDYLCEMIVQHLDGRSKAEHRVL